MAGIGHNRGPELGSTAWRRHAWGRARRDLLPSLPIEVVRLRVARAQALGLDYRTYASVRAATGHDVVGFLFSTNALQMLRRGEAPPEARAARLAQLAADRTALAQPPLDPAQVLGLAPLDAAHSAPSFGLGWAAMRDHLAGVIRSRGVPANRLLVVGETAAERDWSEAARTAGYLSGARYFGAA
ncbi:hypothetical protein [Pseudoroseicyclus aestuarii]|uniref:Uncharacterized protein n=1 Tax=Pseudoroseicyclus aestuarii TaxID=1795041 RepID=A0A318SZS0_9RHOB|nr:hypothetical protein [Pseudoroseicyclus aestuarii]PYE85926.1 hypothetical protein DFP88_101600 [Pseudoroseicyclus aestuarii]